MILYQRKVIWIFDENIFMFFFLFFSFFFFVCSNYETKNVISISSIVPSKISSFLKIFLTELKSYIKHFFKTSENDLIYLFQQGSNDWNNKIRFFLNAALLVSEKKIDWITKNSIKSIIKRDDSINFFNTFVCKS